MATTFHRCDIAAVLALTLLLWKSPQQMVAGAESKVNVSLPAPQQQPSPTKVATPLTANTTLNTATLKDITPARDVQIEGKMSHAARLGIAALPEEHGADMDGRRAYLSNPYGTRGGGVSAVTPSATEVVTPPPLYKLLQQQMEQVLAATGNDFKAFPMQPYTKRYKLKDAEESFVAQVPPKKPLFTFHNEEADDYTDETEAETDIETENESDSDGSDGGYGGMASMQTVTTATRIKPNLTRRPGSITASSSSGSTKTTTGTIPTTPHESAADVPQPEKLTANATSHSAVLKQKRRITFKTVSTSSQFVSTPLADIMLKFSIGIAKPSNPLEGANNNASDITAATEAMETQRNADSNRQTSVVKNKHVKNRKPKAVY